MSICCPAHGVLCIWVIPKSAIPIPINGYHQIFFPVCLCVAILIFRFRTRIAWKSYGIPFNSFPLHARLYPTRKALGERIPSSMAMRSPTGAARCMCIAIDPWNLSVDGYRCQNGGSTSNCYKHALMGNISPLKPVGMRMRPTKTKTVDSDTEEDNNFRNGGTHCERLASWWNRSSVIGRYN